MYSVRDSLRPLIAWGYRRLQAVPFLQPNLNLNDLYLAVLLAARTLHVRLRPEIKAGESFGADLTVRNAVDSGQTDNDGGLAGLCLQLRSERPPEALLEQIVTTVQDRFLGFEALALASIAERGDLTAALHELPRDSGGCRNTRFQGGARTRMVALLAGLRVLARCNAARLGPAPAFPRHQRPLEKRQVQGDGHRAPRPRGTQDVRRRVVAQAARAVSPKPRQTASDACAATN